MEESFRVRPAALARLLAEGDGEWADSPSHRLRDLVAAAQEGGALARPLVGGADVEAVVYPQDDEYDGGYILAVRPIQSVPWLAYDVQVCTLWSDVKDVVSGADDGRTLEAVAAQANRLLPALRTLAGAK